MAKWRVYIEETSVRLFHRTVEADTHTEATAKAQEALEDDSWTEWDHSQSDVSSLKVLADGTEFKGDA